MGRIVKSKERETETRAGRKATSGPKPKKDRSQPGEESRPRDGHQSGRVEVKRTEIENETPYGESKGKPLADEFRSNRGLPRPEDSTRAGMDGRIAYTPHTVTKSSAYGANAPTTRSRRNDNETNILEEMFNMSRGLRMLRQ